MAKTGFGNLKNAARIAKTMRRISENAIERMRPAPTYGTVISIDRTSRVAMVRFGSVESDPVAISMASMQPSRPGQVVRVEGLVGDRYIADVLGESVIAGGIPVGMLFEWPGITVPPWALVADGRLISTDVYVSLFNELGYRHGGTGSQFALPTRTSASQNIQVLIRAV